MKKVYLIHKNREAASALGELIKRLRSFGYTFEEITTEEQISSIQKPEAKMALVAVDADDKELSCSHLVSQFKTRFSHVEVVAAFKGKLEFDQQLLMDADVDAVYQYPFDDELLINHFFEKDPVALSNNQLSFEHLARVNVVELKAGDRLPFALFVFLPANKKIIPYNHKDQALDDEVLDKFKNNKSYNLYIKKTDLHAYYEYCGKLLKESVKGLGGEDYTQEVTRQMRSLLSGFFDRSPGNMKESGQILDNLGKIVSQLEDESGSKVDLMEEVSKVAARQLTNYSHAKNMATYCAMFGMMAGINEPQSLRIGGMLHDLGMMDLPLSLLHKNEVDMDDLEIAQFKLHPGNAKMTLIEKGMKVPKSVENMIMQHHEKPDGTGFPYGLTADKIGPMAKICAFADLFDTLTSVREGYLQLSPMQAMMRISGRDGYEPESIYEHNFHGKIVDAFVSGEFEINQPATLEKQEDKPGMVDLKESTEISSGVKKEKEKEQSGEIHVSDEKTSYGLVKSNLDASKAKEASKMSEEEKMGYVLSQMFDDDSDEEVA